MNRYNFEISGVYEDWAKIVVDNQLIHNGSIVGIIKKENTDTLISLNYDTDSIYTYVLKKKDEYIVGIPSITEGANVQKYYPLVFTEEEYDGFLQKCYTDESITSGLQECKNEELIQMWACSHNASIFSQNTSDVDINSLYNSIVLISNNMSVDDLEDFLSSKYLKLEEFSQSKKVERITMYLDLGNVEEWNCLIAIDNDVYLKLTDTFVIRFSNTD